MAHLALLTLFGMVGFATLQDAPTLLLANSYDGPELLEDFTEISLEAPEVEPIDFEETVEEPILADLSESLMSELDAPWESAALGADALAPNPHDAALADMLAGESGGALRGDAGAGEQPGGGQQAGARFFGAASRGDRIVFVVDNSGSMVDGRMETTFMELMRCVGAMKPRQKFHVLFYSDQAYPMFFPTPVRELVPATRENIQRLGQWLRTVETCRGGALREAMDLAASLRPQVVYLLTDGDYLFVERRGRRAKSSTLKHLTAPNDWGFVIHTLGMTVRDAEDAEALALIAGAHRGGYTHVTVNPIAARMARERRLPHHSRPGPVWGSKVR